MSTRDRCLRCGAGVPRYMCEVCEIVHPVAASWLVYLLRFNVRRGV
jgi:hypothetical protein